MTGRPPPLSFDQEKEKAMSTIEEYWRIQWEIAVTDDRERKLPARQKELRAQMKPVGSASE